MQSSTSSTSNQGVNVNTHYLKHVRQLFATYNAPPSTIRHYQRQWVQSIRRLGDRWLLAHHVQRLEL